MWGSNWLPCWLQRGWQVSHQRWIPGNVYHIYLCQVQKNYPVWLWHPEETSPEVQNRVISGHIERTYALKKNLKKKQKKLEIVSGVEVSLGTYLVVTAGIRYWLASSFSCSSHFSKLKRRNSVKIHIMQPFLLSSFWFLTFQLLRVNMF